MSIQRKGLTYFSLVIITMILGLSARNFSIYLPDWINMYLGDILWALMVFLLLGFIFRTRQTKWIALLSLLFSFGIEISQLYQSPWIDTLRQTRLGGLVLGFGFLWSDLVSYVIGIGLGVISEKLIIFKENT